MRMQAADEESRALSTALARSLECAAQGWPHGAGEEALVPYSAPPFPVPESERVTLFDWMVLTCYQRSSSGKSTCAI